MCVHRRTLFKPVEQLQHLIGSIVALLQKLHGELVQRVEHRGVKGSLRKEAAQVGDVVDALR